MGKVYEFPVKSSKTAKEFLSILAESEEIEKVMVVIVTKEGGMATGFGGNPTAGELSYGIKMLDLDVMDFLRSTRIGSKE